jgi:hypothetical protein
VRRHAALRRQPNGVLDVRRDLRRQPECGGDRLQGLRRCCGSRGKAGEDQSRSQADERSEHAGRILVRQQAHDHGQRPPIAGLQRGEVSNT